MTDQDLLRRYVDARDESAFAELVRRHGGMVHATAARIAGDDDADDVAQAAFLLLARRASRLASHPNLAGWLYNAARYCAANARRTRLRRQKHTQAAAGEIAMQIKSASSDAAVI